MANIVVCDYCKEQGDLIEAIDIVPAVTLLVSKQRINEVGLCDMHKRHLYPESFNGAKRSYTKAEREPIKGGVIPVADDKTQVSARKLGAQRAAKKRKANESRLPMYNSNGTTLFNTRQIAERLGRGMKSMGYVMRDCKPVGREQVDGKGTPIFVYHINDLMRAGVFKKEPERAGQFEG